MHKSKPSKHNLVVDRQKAKEFLAKRKKLKEQRDEEMGHKEQMVHKSGRKLENDDV